MNAALLLPEYIIALGAIVALLIEGFRPNTVGKKTALLVGFVTVLFTLVAVLFQGSELKSAAFHNLLSIDPLSFYLKFLLLIGTFVTFFMVWRSQEISDHFSEFTTMVLTVLFGSFLLISAKNMLMVYLGLETASIVSYILSGIKKTDDRSSEASLKYVVYGSLASSLMVFGMSYLYGVTGSLDFTTINSALSTKVIEPELLWLCLALIFGGLGYKISAAPFHMWAPDVYEGSPLPVTAFFSVVPKTAGVAAIARFLYTTFSTWDSAGGVFKPLTNLDWSLVVSIIAVVTMFAGNLAALQQTNVKRLLAYSSISHAGFLLFGLSAHDQDGLVATLFYVSIYYVMNLGAFWIANEVQEWSGSEGIDGFRGLGLKSPAAAIFMMIFLFSLTGLPPFAGFVAKWYVFAAVIKKGMYGAAVAGVVNSVIALFYYAKIVRVMFFDRQVSQSANVSPNRELTMDSMAMAVILVVPTVALGLFWEPLYQFTKHAAAMFGVN